MRRVLVLYYSQTGQLEGAIRSLVDGLDRESFDLTLRTIRPRQEYPFPWSVRRFFGIFPDCVLGAAPGIEPLDLEPDARFDLVILGLTVWFLAPSLPIQGFFQSSESRVMRDTPVITVIACRNMWHNASETIKREIKRVGGLHIDNVVVTDQGPAWATFVTTPRWMFTGRNDAFGIFPPAGVAPEALVGFRRFGEAISRGATGLDHRPPSPLLRGRGAVSVEQRYSVPELIGKYSFPAWARLIRAAGRFGSWLTGLTTVVFVLYLVFAILILVPLSIIARIALYPIMRRWYRSQVQRLKSPSEQTL